MVWFHLDAPSSQAGARKPRGLDIGIGSRIKSQAKFQTAARRESSEDSMKRAFLLIVVPALLVALGFAQTPAASINTDQTTIKGCLGGADGNYTVVQDNTGHTFKITASGVDLKAHLGHDVSLIGHRASGTTSAAADNSFAVAELTMISEHCAAAAAAAPVATTTSTLPETAITPAAPATAPAATVTTTPETVVTPAAPAAPPAETVVTPAAPATPPAETVVTPPVAPAAPAVTAITVSDKPAADAAPPTGRPDRFRSLSAAPVAAAVAPAATTSKSSEPASTPDAAATAPAAPVNSSSETVNTPQAATTTPAAPARRGGLWLLIAFAVLVIVLGIFFPLLSRWRKQKSLARTDAPNLSFTREASSDQDKPDEPRKVA
ncbi:hypothetical protein SBA7_1510013 [Candidatus Sulfotelmatobacter sp. SbA7]|nr:hypothetical protein SBA7_1510013 [Candidatus Sulfotelmatobacter sp. SbA7]